MAENPRELIRAAQSAELSGDAPRAVELLFQAATLCQRAGNTPRALQLLRHARRLDGRRADIADEVARLERMSALDADESVRPATLVMGREEGVSPSELALRQRLIEAALREESPRFEEAHAEVTAWVLDTEVSEDLQRLEAQLSLGSDTFETAGERDDALSAEDEGGGAFAERAGLSSRMQRGDVADRVTRGDAWSVTAGTSPDSRFMARRAGSRSRARSAGELGGAQRQGGSGSDEASWSPGLLDEWDGPEGGVSGADDTSDAAGAGSASEAEDETWLLGDLGESASPEGSTGSGLFGAPQRAMSDEVEGVDDTQPQRRRKPRIIERGPTIADVNLDAWCSFCCRPRAEIGELVAGPAGAFICKSCLTASASLLGDSVSPAPLLARPRVETPPPGAPDFIGQPESRSALVDALRTGVRCVLLIGAEGCGKSTLLRLLQREGQGALTTVDALAEAPSSTPLFIEDVDLLSPGHQLALSAFLGRAARPAVVLSARGKPPASSKLALRAAGLRLDVPTTDALSRAVHGTLPVSILEHVQRLVSLRPPTSAEYKDMARAHLASREHATTLSEKALAVLVAEAARSPRAGHELQALLQRIPPGTWDLDKVTKPAPARKGRRKKGTS
ncbi:ClpX C4-type zinc finger protein [Myxococcus fulvus]|uniref:ClpX C4-type zinc finger protein n=1 Tax=Myxococcus fulvus TaxID=33 RepID=UPI003B99C5D6